MKALKCDITQRDADGDTESVLKQERRRYSAHQSQDLSLADKHEFKQFHQSNRTVKPNCYDLRLEEVDQVLEIARLQSEELCR